MITTTIREAATRKKNRVELLVALLIILLFAGAWAYQAMTGDSLARVIGL